MTREQISTALEYNRPNEAIAQIHDRNKDRLDPISTLLETRRAEGDRYVTRNTYVYTLRGVMEICRFSRQPNAEGVQFDNGIGLFYSLIPYSTPLVFWG